MIDYTTRVTSGRSSLADLEKNLWDASYVNNYYVLPEKLAGDDPVMQAFAADVRKAYPKGKVIMHDLIVVLAGGRKRIKPTADLFTAFYNGSWVEQIAQHPSWEDKIDHIHEALRNYAVRVETLRPETVTEEYNLLQAITAKQAAAAYSA